MDTPDLEADAIIFTQPSKDVGWEESEEEGDSETAEGDSKAGTAVKKAKWSHRESMYVRLFSDMLDAVLEKEAFLFSDFELELFSRFRQLSYPARYLLVRLTLRKESKWHRSDVLLEEYGDDIDGIIVAMKELCNPLGSHPSSGEVGDESKPGIEPSGKDELSTFHLVMKKGTQRDVKPKVIKEEEREYIIIDDDDDECGEPFASTPLSSQHNEAESKPNENENEAGPSETHLHPLPTAPSALALWFLAQDDSHASIEETCAMLLSKELKDVAKAMKISSGKMKRSEVVAALVKSASKQASLSYFFESSPAKGKGHDAKPTKQRTLDSFHPKSTSRAQTSRLRAIVQKITGPCLRINAEIFKLFQRLNLVYFRSTQPTQPLLPLILANAKKTSPRRRNYPNYTAVRTAEIFVSRDALLAYEEAICLESQVDEALGKLSRREGAQRVIGIFRPAYDRWVDLVASQERDPARHGALSRFEEGHVLTRIVHKGAQCHGVLKEWDIEKEILWKLLEQEKWRTGSRGKWYERLALLLMKSTTEKSRWEAKEVVEKALQDPKTHLIYWSALERRLARLDKSLKIPEQDRHKTSWILKKCPHILITGRRVNDAPVEATPAPIDHDVDDIIDIETPARTPLNKANSATPRKLPEQSPASSTISAKVISLPAGPSRLEKQPVEEKKGGKSVWKGQDDEISVEEFALEYYQRLGYKGFHSEGRIVVHLFTLLFWSVLFDSSVPGAFETPFQMAPLDLVHDSFFASREDTILERLNEIEGGAAAALIEETDDRERPTKTWAVGVRWDDFSKEDALEIAQGLGGKALSVMCRLLCEEYSQRASGVPDLIIWNAADVKFVEVKGPGDTLQENQKVWIDIMVGSGIPVEVCHVEEEGFEQKGKRAAKSKAAKLNNTAARFKRGSSQRKQQKKVEKDEEELENEDPLFNNSDDGAEGDGEEKDWEAMDLVQPQTLQLHSTAKRPSEESTVRSPSKRRRTVMIKAEG